MKSGRILYCGTCGKDVEVVPVAFLGMYEGGYVYEALCPNGHCFSITGNGYNEIILDIPPEKFGLF